MSGSLTRVHRHPVKIGSIDIDHLGHVNNAVYLQWVQSAVMDYWESVASAEAVVRHAWVALKHEVTYRRPAFLAILSWPRFPHMASGARGSSSTP